MSIKSVQLEGYQAKVISPSIMKNSRFVFLWIASAFSGLALSMYLITESWFVVNGLKMEAWLGIVMMVTTIPRVFLMMLGGAIADRFKRSTVLFLSNTTRGILVVGLVLILLGGWMNVWILMGFALCFGILDAFFWPSSNSLIPMIVAKENITRANSIIQTTSQFSIMVGPALAGFAIKFGSFEASFGIAAILLIISGLIVRKMNEPVEKVTADDSSLIKEIKEGISYVKGFPYLIIVMCSSVIVNFFLVGPMNVGLPLLVENVLKGDVLDLSYLETALAVGMFSGAILVGVLNIKKKRAVISLVLIGIMGISNGLLSNMHVVTYGIVILVISGICLAISNIISPSLTQELVDQKMMGRVQSLMATASVGFTPISFALVSVLLSIGVQIGTIMMISCFAMTVFVTGVLLFNRTVWKVD
jgi:MFS transporter, DHA3 family, macrolide efflux protein